jgi:hypothetical protein
MTVPFKQGVCRLLILAFLALTAIHSQAQDTNDDIYGKWKITAILGGGIGSLSGAEARKLIGKPLLVSPERFEFNGETCMNPNYQRSKEDPATYFDREWRTDVSDIPFPSPVTIIETDCDFLYPIREGHLMIAEGGVFFEAVRIQKLPSQSPQRHHRP